MRRDRHIVEVSSDQGTVLERLRHGMVPRQRCDLCPATFCPACEGVGGAPALCGACARRLCVSAVVDLRVA